MGSTLKLRKSVRSSNNGGACVEVAHVPGAQAVAARDSKRPGGPHLTFRRSAWSRFLAEVKGGSHDLS
jgi:hypothetical protein